jgi:hypothetical protein
MTTQKKGTIAEILKYLDGLQNAEIDDHKLLKALKVLAEYYNLKIQDDAKEGTFKQN